MKMKPITESNIETFAIETLESLGWQYIHGLTIAPNAELSERTSFEQVILTSRLRKQLAVINPEIPDAAREQAINKMSQLYSPELMANNEEFHQFLIEKVKIPYQQDGYQRSHEVALIDFENIENNEFLVVNQLTVVENNQNKRPDILLFVNGIPLVVIELKNAADEKATVRSAFEQIQTYKAIIPSLFKYNAVCVISDGMEARAGSLSADFSRCITWKTVDGVKEASKYVPQLETLIKGMLNRTTLLDLVRNFIVFEKSKKEDAKTGIITIDTEKKVAAYHQY
ncbi:MAG: type I restriction endonuclease, partial [Pyrinomonadaceae bacterium]